MFHILKRAAVVSFGAPLKTYLIQADVACVPVCFNTECTQYDQPGVTGYLYTDHSYKSGPPLTAKAHTDTQMDPLPF